MIKTKRKWWKISLGLLLLLLIIPVIVYLTKLDWSKHHSAQVAQLQELNSSAISGKYRVPIGDKEFLIRLAGWNNDGPTAILLHGFPESSVMWEPLMQNATDLGYRVLAFDQRGYSPGARPKGKENYHVDSLVQDVIGIADYLNIDTFHLVGHDWGSGVGWRTVMEHPDRVHTWTAMSVAHIGVFFDAVLNDPEQKEKSAYMLKLRWPILPELLAINFQNIIYAELEKRWGVAGHVDEYKAIQSEPGAMTAMLNWYRALDYEDPSVMEQINKKINRPTLFLWGNEDPIIAHHVVPLQAEYVDTTFQSVELDAGHSLMQEAEEEVINLIIEHWESN